jgi:hypothetical protein
LENFERTHFVVLTGHLDDRPLPELVRTLRAQRKTGRLQIEYPEGPAAFFFEDGQIVDAQMGTLRGLEALYAAVAMRGASFNFNPLVRPPERSIDRQQQQFISDLIEAERRESLPEINAEGRSRPTAIPFPARPEPLQLGPVAAELIAPLEERLVAVEAAISVASRRFSRERLIYAALISFLGALVIGTLLQVLYNFPAQNQTPPVAAASQQSPKPEVIKPEATSAAATQPGDVAQAATAGSGASKEHTASDEPNRERADARQTSVAARRAAEAARQSQSQRQSAARAAGRQTDDGGGVPSGHVVQVLMEVRNGQVTSARVLNPRPGAADYESLALRMARQRRYPESFTGAERLQLRVKP